MKKLLPVILLGAVLSFNTQAQSIFGTDVYHGDDPINWSTVKSAGVGYAWCKSSQGTGTTDPDFASNMSTGVSAKEIMGAYHYATPENDSADVEAKFFVSVAGAYMKPGCLPPALDLEDPASGPTLSSSFSSAALTAWVNLFCSTVQSLTGVAPIIYTEGSIANYLQSSVTKYGLWTADPDGSATAIPSSTYLGVWGTKWLFKQYTWTATINGLGNNPNSDEDVFNGDSTAFNKLIGGAAVTPAFTSNVRSGCVGLVVKYTDKSTSTGTITGYKWTFQGGSPATSTVATPTVTYTASGTYNVSEVVTSTTGKDSITSTAYINVIPTASLPLSETFQSSTFPPTGWTMNYPSPGDSAWQLCTSIGYNSTQCMYFPANCGNSGNISGERQQIYTPDFSFAGVTNAEMSFEVAYEPSNLTSTPKYSDTLVVYYSLDCGTTWKSIYSKGGATLCTTGSTTNANTDVVTTSRGNCFEPPSTSAWRRDSISLSAVNGQSSVMFSFENRSGWGNIMYLDNININTYSPTSVQAIVDNYEVKVYPNPNKGLFTMQINNAQLTMGDGQLQVDIYNVLGEKVYSTSSIVNSQLSINLDTQANGIYFYRVMTEEGNKFIAEGKLIVQK